MSLREITKNRSSISSDDALLKLFNLALRKIEPSQFTMENRTQSFYRPI